MEDRVEAEWIERILKAQQPDGGWRDSFHTSVLGLWVLLEVNDIRGNPDENWIPRPD